MKEYKVYVCTDRETVLGWRGIVDFELTAPDPMDREYTDKELATLEKYYFDFIDADDYTLEYTVKTMDEFYNLIMEIKKTLYIQFIQVNNDEPNSFIIMI